MKVVIEDDWNGTLTRIIQYLLEKEGHAVSKEEDKHELEVVLNRGVSKYFE